MNVYLITITASHYRKLIYKLLLKELNCNFIFGDDYSSVKKLNSNEFPNSINLKNSYLIGSLYIQKELTKNIKNPDIIINDLGIMCLNSWILLIKSLFNKTRIYNWDHGWYGREGFLKKWIKRAYFGLADGTFLYGNYAKSLMIENGFNANKLHVIHNSLDYDSQILIRKRLRSSDIYINHFKNNHPVLCFIGRLTKVKKLNLVIESVKILKDRGEFFNIIFVGEGEMISDLKNKACEFNLQNNIWFYGDCYDEEKNAEIFYNADMCVAPGNIGLTAIHAMMFGCPCISHNDLKWQMPEFEAIQEGETGSFFERDNVYSLANCISSWFYKNKNRREFIRNSCYKEIDENWNPHKQIEIIKNNINK